jgi:hypothetical protein
MKVAAIVGSIRKESFNLELTDEPTIKHLDLVSGNFVKWAKEQSRLKQLQSLV